MPAVAREMARSGDWITPRLWGSPWFEKPALLYWMSGAAFRVGIQSGTGAALAGRAARAAASSVFYWFMLRREFG